MFDYSDVSRLAVPASMTVVLTPEQWAVVWIAFAHAQELYFWDYDAVDEDDLDNLIGETSAALLTNVSGAGMVETVVVMDVRAYDEEGGACVAGWQQRALNDIQWIENPGWVSLDSDVITLQSGRYLIDFYAPAHKCGIHFLELRTSESIVLATSPALQSNATTASDQNAHGTCVVQLSAETDLELWHYTTVAAATNGLGRYTGVSGSPSQYATVVISRVGDAG